MTRDQAIALITEHKAAATRTELRAAIRTIEAHTYSIAYDEGYEAGHNEASGGA